MPFLLPILAGLGVPARFQRLAAYVALAVAVLALLGALWGGYALWLHHHTQQAVVTDRAIANAKAQTSARAADQQAAAVVATSNKEVSDANMQAQAAADSSDDPLAAGLNSLRHNSAGGDRQAGRRAN